MSRKPNTSSLTHEQILQAALKILDEDGLSQFSMRHLAQTLGVDAKAVYYYFENKEAIIVGAIELGFAQLALPQQTMLSWQDDVRNVLTVYRSFAIAHPHLFIYLVTYNENFPVAYDIDERLVASLLRANVKPANVVQIVDVLLTYIAGFALAEMHGLVGRSNNVNDVHQQFLQLSPQRYPSIHLLAQQLTPSELRTDFDFSLRLLIHGIEAVLKS
jgi:TetR/AcrR family transcriptional regulator, tetracycline repressor protein